MIGVWGYGISGRSVVRFLRAQNEPVLLLEARELSQAEHAALAELGVAVHVGTVEQFFERCTQVVLSPGIDMRAYCAYRERCIAELDVFARYWHKPIIAITGSLGKTTVTTLIAGLLRAHGERVALGGNIGVGVCDLLAQQDASDVAVVEVSSFQLEHARMFAPTVAVWTNFHPNHLDRHGTIDAYWRAKMQVCARAQRIVVCPESAQLPVGLSVEELPTTTFISNWITVCAALQAWGISDDRIALLVRDAGKKQAMPAYRLQQVTSVPVPVFNDSKSTVSQATLAAVQELAQRGHRSQILLLGGLSKGVNREPLIQALAATGVIKEVVCFGAEAQQLYAWCVKFLLPASFHMTLEEAISVSIARAHAGDCILFSPAGASYDLFTDYQERGARFNEWIAAL